MKFIEDDIGDDEVRVIGQPKKRKKFFGKSFFVLFAAIIIIAVALFYALPKYVFSGAESAVEAVPAYYEREPEELDNVGGTCVAMLGDSVGNNVRGFVEILDTAVNDIFLKLFIPHNSVMSLHVGAINRNDTTILFATQAADIRQDNGEILGTFVMQGKPLSFGLSKKGYCAVIDGEVTIGVAENSPLFEEATQRDGYFFRQYPLVDNGVLVESVLKGKSLRRALCERHGQVFMAMTTERESMHDFAQALVDIGVTNAVYLVGGTIYGWALDREGERHEWGTWTTHVPQNITYIVWRRNQ